MNKTKIDWCDSTFNPVTGCLHGCEYCYARSIVRRFEGKQLLDEYGNTPRFIEEIMNLEIVVADKPQFTKRKDGKLVKSPYPFGFKPMLHRYRLDELQKLKKPSTIFVCSMADLFGEWVPDEWISEVFKACEAASQHRYLFLTKNPKRYMDLNVKRILPKGDNYWFGSTAISKKSEFFGDPRCNTFLSIEPIMSDFGQSKDLSLKTNWIIIGAESGNRKDKVIPEREWIETIVTECRAYDIPIFMKSSLADMWGEPLIQQFPWKVG